MDFVTGITRILDTSGQTVGTGFVLTGDGLIATCAHIVKNAGAGPDDSLRLIFYHTAGEATATVEPDGWRAPDVEDIAILRLNGPLPAGVRPLPLGYSTGSDGHTFKTFGFPDPNPIGGLRGDGHILGRVTLDNGVQALQLRSQEVTGGFSGAPVWDEVIGRVVGMVTATTDPDQRGRLTETAFATPTETFLDVWPSLHVPASSLIGHPLPSTHFGPSLSSPSIIPQEQISYVVPALLVSQFEHLATQLSAETERHLEIMRTALREGRQEEAINWLVEIEADHARWSVLSPEVKAKLLCFEASIVLDTTNETNRAKQLADRAHDFAATSNEMRVRAFITYLEGDPVAAIRLLEGQDDIDSLNLRAALLLEMNRIDECRAVLEQASTDSTPNPETLRIYALFHLVTKDINQAQLEIQKALEFGSRWQSIRFAAAVIHYFSALSSLALPDRLVPWPEPVDSMLLKRDDESLSRLREAAQIFQELAQTTHNAREEKYRFEAWRLACLVTDPDRQEEANKYAQILLQETPTNFRLIAWIVAHNLEVNLEPSRLALEQLVTDGAAHIFHIVALASCYLVFQNAPEAVKLLDDTKSIFQEHQAEALWTFWYVQALVIQGEIGAAFEVIDSSELKAELQPIQTMVLVAKARESGNWQELVQHLEDIYEATGDINFLLDLCEIMAQQHNWDYIADRAESLTKEVSTSEAVRLAVIAAHNAGRFKFCLELIDRHQHFFRQGKLPNQLRQIRVACQQALGLLPEAIIEAETLAREEPTVENLLALANLYLNKGDLKGLTIVARKLNNRTDLMPRPLLGLARLVQWEDRGLAISFWRKAISQELPDELVSEALAMGFQLGLDDEVALLMERMAELGHQGKGGIQVKSVEDFIEFFKQRQEHAAKLDEIYRDGTGPIHLIAEQFSWSLVDLYHRTLTENETTKDPMRQFVLLARHGGRALLSGFPDSRPPWRLNLDITAILLAAHLDILTEIEETFKPLHIPAALIPALLRMRERISPHQLSRLEIYRQIIDLQQRDMLAVVQCEVTPDYPNAQLVMELGEEWIALFEEVRTNGGYLVAYLPLRKRVSGDPPTALPEDAVQYLINCRGIVDTLREHGPLSEEAYSDAIQALGTEGVVSSDTVPMPGKLLYCYGNIPEVLAEANLLQLVCQRFQVRISQHEFGRVQGALKEYEQGQATAEWLDRLIDQLNRGLDDGTYAIIPTPPHEEGEMEERAVENPDVECLRTVLKFEAAEGDVVWADDRWINRYLHRNGMPIIGINEILKSLVGVGTLTARQYYQKIIKLRAANVRFIPVQTDEIIYQFRQARVENRELVETQELEILRRYVAACLYRGDILQRPMKEGRPNEHDELAFLLGLGRTLTNAFVELWATEEDDEITRQARAEWLLANLYLDHLGLSKVTELLRVQQDDRYMAAISLTGLIAHAISFEPKYAAARRDYLDWLFHRILRKRFDADPELVLLVADLLKKTLLDTIQGESVQDLPEPVMILLLQKFYDDLPTAIHDELGRDTDFMARIGLINLKVITIDEFNFEGNDFIQAANEAVNGRRATITLLGSDTEIIFQPVEDHPGEFIFSYDHPETGAEKVIAGDNLVILLGSPSEREMALRRNRQWFDCPQQKLDKIVAEIASMEDPQRRIDAVEGWRNVSVAVYYSNLDGILRNQRDFQFDDLIPPSAEGLLRHLRLSPDVESGETFQEALATTAQTLIDEESLILAIDRLTGLPTPLPTPLVEAFTALSPVEQQQIIKRLIKIAGSPLSRIHLVHLLLHSGNQVPAFQRLAWWIVKNLFSPEGVEAVDAFFAMLKWANGEIGSWPDARHWPPHIRLTMVWAHAHRLFSIFISAGAPIFWLQDTFSQVGQRIYFEVFEWDADYWFDIAHPRNVNQDAFLLAGLSYALGQETNGFIEKGLQDLVVSRAFMNLEGVWVPNLKLRDSSQAPNSLNSFLGGDLGEKLSPLLGTETAATFTHASLQNLIEQTIDNIAKESNVVLHWAWLHALLGDMRPSRELVDRLRSTLSQIDFEGLLEKNVELGLLVIQVASLQVKHLDDEPLRLQLKNGLVQIAKRLADLGIAQEVNVNEDEDDLAGRNEIYLRLLEAALHISKAVQSSENVTTEFLDTVTQLIEIWSTLIPIFKPIIQRLCEELPITQAQQFWPLLVRLRAE